LLDRLTESVTVYDREGRLRYINAAGARWFSLPLEDLIGHRPWDLVASPPTSAFRDALRNVLSGGPKQTIESLAQGIGRWFESDVHPYGDGALVVARDVTERKLAEDRRARTQRLEAMGRLAGGVAHDFNNLLGVILGTTELLMDRLPADHPDRTELAEIAGAASRAAMITRQLLAFGRAQALTPQVISLADVVEGMRRVLLRILGVDIELALELHQECGSVRVDPGQMEQVLLNLAVNARDAMPTGGRFTVEAKSLTIPPAPTDVDDDGLAPGRYVKLTVRDTGTGMTEEVQRQLFEPFFTTKEVGHGTGLGLATVHGIVEQSGGTIRVRSQLGEGTAFHIYLPREADSPARTTDSTIPPSPLLSGSETILVVEDDPATRQYVQRLLRQYGYTVLEAQNGGEALLIVEQHAGPLHLLVADVVMPRMSGPQLAARLRSVRAHLQACFISGYGTDRLDASGLGPKDALVSKPFRPRELLAAVRRVLDRPPDSSP
jgi:PAS domain S-box-containing protein